MNGGVGSRFLACLVVLCSFVAFRPAAADAGRLPLLGDGAYLERVYGTLEPGQGAHGWTFRLRDTFEGGADRLLELLPSSTLEDMVRRFDSMPSGGQARFEISGRVTAYRNVNALLPLMAVPVLEFPARSARPAMRPPGAVLALAPVPAPDSAQEPTPGVRPSSERLAFASRWMSLALAPSADEAARPAGDVRSADVERALEAAVGEIPRSMDMTAASADAERRASLDAPRGGGVDPLRERPWLESDQSVQDRLGVVTRDPVTGGWRFVFESSRGDFGERDATLLPCATLERLERQARSRPDAFTVVLSGVVSRYQGRAYLLPTSFSAPAAGKGLGR
ncbi:MAG: hypothetical protein ACO32J_04635 [Phycisphaerales bacterium]